MVAAGMVQVEVAGISSRIFIEATVEAGEGEASVTIQDAHTHIVRITENGCTVLEEPGLAGSPEDTGEAMPLIHRYTLAQLREYALTVPAEELAFIRRAFEMNLALCQAGLDSPRTTYARYLLAENGGQLISRDERATASLLCNGAIEARVLGLPQPAMSITGSGAHGIIATMPLYAAYRVQGYPEEKLLRAAALSYLVCMYIKEYSGKLSAFCGCAIAAGTGTGPGPVPPRGGGGRGALPRGGGAPWQLPTRAPPPAGVSFRLKDQCVPEVVQLFGGGGFVTVVISRIDVADQRLHGVRIA